MTTESSLVARVRQEIPGLLPEQTEELARMLGALVEVLQPEQIYVFGSRARGEAQADSDVDLLVIVPHSAEPGYRRDQAAYRAVGLHRLPLDILVLTREEFETRISTAASLPATIAREGRVLYAGTA